MTRSRASRRLVLLTVAGLVLASGLWRFFISRHATGGLPYHDSFAQGKADEWKALGGTWELADGSMRNDSDERGAKLLTGSFRWSDYSVEADVMLLGLGGDAGLLLRSSDEEQGVDAYTGYYAGLRTVDDSLVIGRAGHGWEEMTQTLTQQRRPGVQASQWYHLKLLAYGCELAAMVTRPPEREGKTIAVKDEDCVRFGRAGLRSYASGGVWRNIVIRPATANDLALMTTAEGARQSRMQQMRPADVQSPWDLYASASGTGSQTLPSSPNAQLISSLRLAAFSKPEMATVRGTVVLASPALFVQDATGGVAAKLAAAQALKVGDEVEVTGLVRANAFSPTLEHATVRVLWENTPMLPVSVTASQAATGAFDATFVEVEGRLSGKQYGPEDSLIFDFDAGPQSFRAVMNRGRGDYLYGRLTLGSMLRLRGIAVSDAAYTHNLVPFALLLRSSDDAVVLAGPPWWSAGHLIAIAAAFLLLALIANFVYHRVESWRLRAVLEERERMAYEMHDTLSQSFAGIGFQLEAIREGMPEQLPHLRQQLDLARELVRHSHDETRRSIAVLRPEQPASDGLLQALHDCAKRLVEGGSVEIVASCSGAAAKMPLRVADTLYHIGQEALANAVRHAHPTRLEIALAYDKGLVQLRIADNGGGFQSCDTLSGLGIRSMRRRAASIGATMHVLSRPGEGTEILISSGLKAPKTSASRPALSAGAVWRRIRHVASTGKLDPNTYRG